METVTKLQCYLAKRYLKCKKRSYYHKQFENFKSDIKKTWKQINGILSKRSKLPEPPKYFVDGNKTLTSDIDIANCFNKFFCEIGPTLANSIKSPPNKSYTDYLKHDILSTFAFDTVTTESVSKIIRNLKPKSSSDDIVPIYTYHKSISLHMESFQILLKQRR